MRSRSSLLILGALAASGVAGLVYEVAWIRIASLTIGSTTRALGFTLGVFFAGLGAGSAYFGRVASRAARPLRLVALVELGIAATGLMTFAAFPLADAALARTFAVSESAVWRQTLEVLAVTVVLGPPAFLMGGTLPLFYGDLIRQDDRLVPRVAGLYAINTLGAAIGCAMAGFVLLPAIGTRLSLAVAASLNLAVAAAAWRCDRGPVQNVELSQPKARHERRHLKTPPLAGRTVLNPALLVTVFLTGFVALWSQVVWARFAALIVPATATTYTLTLTIVLVGIVAGSAAASRLERFGRSAATVGLLQAAAALAMLPVLYMAPDTWRSLGDAWRTYALLFFPSAVISGTILPLAVQLASSTGVAAPAGLGHTLAANTLGGVAGSVAAAILVPVTGLERGIVTVVALAVVAAVVSWLWLDRGWARGTRWALALGVPAVVAGLATGGDTAIPRDFVANTGAILAVVEGAESNLVVARAEGRRLLTSDGWWQGQDEKSNQIMAAHVPMLLHQSPRRVLVIGVGAGQTPSRFLQYDIDRLDAVDIEPAVFDVVYRHFGAEWMNDRRVRQLAFDGQTVIRRTQDRYDVISIEVGQILRPGVASFYTRDFYARARDRLAPGGLVSQFVPLGFLDAPEFASVIRTFLDVFPDSALWFNRSELLLVGTTAGRLRVDSTRLRLLTAPGPVHDDLRFSLWGGPSRWLNQPAVFLGGFLAGQTGLGRISAGAAVYRDDRPVLDYRAARPARQAVDSGHVIDLIRANLDRVNDVMPSGSSPETTARTAAIQRENVADLVSWSFARQASAADSADRRLGLLRQAVDANPGSVRALELLGVEHLRSGRDADALAVLEQAAAIDSDDRFVVRDLGSALWKVGRRDEAIEHYRRAVALWADDPEAQYFLGAALTAQGAPEEGRRHLERALELR